MNIRLKNKNIKQERKEILKKERTKYERIKEENESERNIRINKYNNSPHLKNNNNYYKLYKFINNLNHIKFFKISIWFLKLYKFILNENFCRIKLGNNSYNSINNNKRIDNLNRIKNKTFHEYKKNNLIKPDSSLKNLNKDKLICPLKIQQKTATLNFPNQNKKIDAYGENFENKKYKRIYTNVEKVNDGRIENQVEAGISKDGQFLISVTSSQKIYDEYYNENVENEEMEEKEIDGVIKYNRDDNNNRYEIPEKKVEEIISIVTTKKRNLGDNYKFYENKYLNKPNISSSTKHLKRTERNIFLNEKYKTREIKEYKIKSQVNEYGDEIQQIIEASKKPYEEKGYICGQGYKDRETIPNPHISILIYIILIV